MSPLGPLGHVQGDRFHVPNQILDDFGQFQGGFLDSDQALARSAQVIHAPTVARLTPARR
jgi:hypothetical protein